MRMTFTSWPDRLVKRIEKSRAKKRARVSVESGAVELSKRTSMLDLAFSN